jgi:ribonucleoside-diphosphate reductase alpha chain
MQMRYLFLRLGILTSGCVKDNRGKFHITKDGKTITTKQIAYSLRIPKHPNLKSIIKFKKDGKYFKYFEWNNILWGRIKSINKIHYSGDVYDFNMIDNHNYLTDMGLVHNSGKRKGSFAIYLSPSHPDIIEFLDLRKNQGKEEFRARDLFYAMWMSDLYMNQVKKDGDWYLMDPDECPGLNDVYGEEYENLYWKYVEEKRYRKKIKAQEIWTKILESQIETGGPYILYKDQINKKSNQKNIGVIKSSNLCSEITLVSDNENYAVCNLMSFALPKYIKLDENNKKYFDFQLFYETIKYIVLPMNNVIDYNYYPVPETSKTNFSARPLGLGIQGFSLVLTDLHIPFESDEAYKLNKEIWETMYFASLTGSMELAKKDGPYSRFKGSPLSEGKFQFDLWAEFNGIDLKNYISGRWDWETLRKDIVTHGVRNSTLLCQMPTASSAQIMGNSESVECFDSCIYKRRVLSGEYVVCNTNLVKDLTELNLWNKALKDQIIANDGSIQDIDSIPQNIKDVYKTVWEISMKSVINQAADRNVFICQTQSTNLFIANPTIKKLSSMHFYGFERHLKTGMYYLRSKSKTTAAKFSIGANVTKKSKKSAKKQNPTEEEVLMCSIENKEACDLCTS